MTGVDKSGQRAVVDRVECRPHVLLDMKGRTDEEIRGIFAKTLKLAGITPARARRILRSSRATYFRDLGTQLMPVPAED